jgi:hypothetical protein
MCGLTGYVGPQQAYNKTYMKYLAIKQDSRGGHGCGIAYINPDGFGVHKSVEPPKGKFFKTPNVNGVSEFKDMFTVEYPTPDNCRILLGHARYATVGEISKEFTQPFVIQTPDTTFVVAHNGTVSNWAELADKLFSTTIRADINNDSQFLAHCIAYNKFDEIADKYEGAASILWYDVAEPEIMYMFAGSIHLYENEQLKSARPLHFWTSPRGGTYFSSESGPLFSIRNLELEPGDDVEGHKVFYCPVNQVCKINGLTGEFKSLATYKRIRKYEPAYAPTKTMPRLTFKSDTTPYDMGGLVCKFGVYFIDTEMASSILLDGNGEEIYSMTSGNVAHAVPIYVTPMGKILDYDGTNFEIELSRNLYEIYKGLMYEVYFFRGVMFPTEAALLEYFKTRTNMVYIDMISATANAATPVFSGVNAPDSSQSCYFMTSDKAPLSGDVTFPFARNTYRFDRGSLTNIMPLNKIKIQKRLWAKALEKAGVQMIHTDDFSKNSLRIPERTASNN